MVSRLKVSGRYHNEKCTGKMKGEKEWKLLLV